MHTTLLSSGWINFTERKIPAGLALIQENPGWIDFIH